MFLGAPRPVTSVAQVRRAACSALFTLCSSSLASAMSVASGGGSLALAELALSKAETGPAT